MGWEDGKIVDGFFETVGGCLGAFARFARFGLWVDAIFDLGLGLEFDFPVGEVFDGRSRRVYADIVLIQPKQLEVLAFFENNG